MTGVLDLEAFRRDGVQTVRDFFEPEIRDRFAALGRRIGDEVREGKVGRTAQFMSGLDVNVAAQVIDSQALHQAVRTVLGPDVCVLVGRVLIKDKTFSGAIEAHQDWPYFGGDTRKLNAFIPLTRCRRENGMMVFYEGSHGLGPVERGAIDVDRYPEFEPVCPHLEVGDILFADFLSWHCSVPAVEDEDRILLQVVFQPAADRSSSTLFEREWRALGRLSPYRTTPMLNAVPSVGIGPARGFLAGGEVEEAERMARGLRIDSPTHVEAHLLMHDIALAKGEDGAQHIAAADAALATLVERLAALRPPADLGGGADAVPAPLPDQQARIEQLSAELAAVRNSTSWRITQPLRWAAGRLGRRNRPAH
jgi:hypothetical protein